MPPRHESAATARAAAASVVARVVADRRYLDAALREARAHHDASGFSLVQELAYGTLRWYQQLAAVAGLFVSRPFKAKDRDVHALLLVGLYQLRHMRVADHAAVDATVAAAQELGKGWAKGIINATLRASLRESERVERTLAASDAYRYSHPPWLIDAIRRDHPSQWENILDANNQRPPMTLRVNAARCGRADYQELLRSHGIAARSHASVASALILDQPVPVERLPGFADGLVSVQDAGAQLAAMWLDVPPNARVLDACAAPGGKAAHLLERNRELSELTAIDIDADRLHRVRETFARLGVSARLVAADAADPSAWWDGVPYDRVLLDAPCSATGVIRRHPDVKVRREPEEMAKLLNTQARLLEGVWPCLARGGKLLYVTCSILSDENERQLQTFMTRHPDARAEALETAGAGTGRQILPGTDEMDGFYYARLRKV